MIALYQVVGAAVTVIKYIVLIKPMEENLFSSILVEDCALRPNFQHIPSLCLSSSSVIQVIEIFVLNVM